MVVNFVVLGCFHEAVDDTCMTEGQAGDIVMSNLSLGHFLPSKTLSNTGLDIRPNGCIPVNAAVDGFSGFSILVDPELVDRKRVVGAVGTLSLGHTSSTSLSQALG
jgi:hypothetical protein